eukprot:m.42970 g.42970  ORF g.42970 m.42970 type:complete len:483 (-) comp10752_c0_seq3:277-1725(-)
MVDFPQEYDLATGYVHVSASDTIDDEFSAEGPMFGISPASVDDHPCLELLERVMASIACNLEQTPEMLKDLRDGKSPGEQTFIVTNSVWPQVIDLLAKHVLPLARIYTTLPLTKAKLSELKRGLSTVQDKCKDIQTAALSLHVSGGVPPATIIYVCHYLEHWAKTKLHLATTMWHLADHLTAWSISKLSDLGGEVARLEREEEPQSSPFALFDTALSCERKVLAYLITTQTSLLRCDFKDTITNLHACSSTLTLWASIVDEKSESRNLLKLVHGVCLTIAATATAYFYKSIGSPDLKISARSIPATLSVVSKFSFLEWLACIKNETGALVAGVYLNRRALPISPATKADGYESTWQGDTSYIHPRISRSTDTPSGILSATEVLFQYPQVEPGEVSSHHANVGFILATEDAVLQRQKVGAFVLGKSEQTRNLYLIGCCDPRVRVVLGYKLSSSPRKASKEQKKWHQHLVQFCETFATPFNALT